jgi:hypothetical protein
MARIAIVGIIPEQCAFLLRELNEALRENADGSVASLTNVQLFDRHGVGGARVNAVAFATAESLRDYDAIILICNEYANAPTRLVELMFYAALSSDRRDDVFLCKMSEMDVDDEATASLRTAATASIGFAAEAGRPIAASGHSAPIDRPSGLSGEADRGPNCSSFVADWTFYRVPMETTWLGARSTCARLLTRRDILRTVEKRRRRRCNGSSSSGESDRLCRWGPSGPQGPQRQSRCGPDRAAKPIAEVDPPQARNDDVAGLMGHIAMSVRTVYRRWRGHRGTRKDDDGENDAFESDARITAMGRALPGSFGITLGRTGGGSRSQTAWGRKENDALQRVKNYYDIIAYTLRTFFVFTPYGFCAQIDDPRWYDITPPPFIPSEPPLPRLADGRAYLGCGVRTQLGRLT